MDEEYDTKILRRNMFVCNNERGDNLQQIKMTKMRWDKCFKDMHTQVLEETIEAFPTSSRALRDIDVLENIASYLTNNDLLICRQVCRVWSIEMARFLFKRKSLIVVDQQCRKAEAVLKKRFDGCPIAVSKLCLFDIGSACPIYKKLFSVFGSTLSSVSLEECQLTASDLKRLLLDYAPSIEYFHMKEVGKRQRSKISTLKQIKMLNNGSLVFPRMKMLHWDEEDGRTELEDIIEACPNLVTLELRDFPVPRAPVFKNLQWNALRNLFLSPKNVMRDEHCKALAYLKLQLRTLTLFGINSREKAANKALNKFLSTLSDTLETLELWLDYASVLSNPVSETYSPFPVFLPKVQRLKTESEILGHIRHLKKLPVLAELEVVSNPHERQNWDTLTKRATMPALETLRSLRCGDIDSKSLSNVMKVFPNITSLHFYATHVNDAFLRSVIINLPCLIDLSISPCMTTSTLRLRLTDSGITGISKKICTKLQQDSQGLEKVNLTAVKTQPGIGDLKRLQTLDFGMQVSEISDISVFLSISTLPKLCCLKLPLCKISDASVDLIEKRLNLLVVLSIAGCSGVTSQAVENLKKRRSDLFIETDVPPMFENLR